jgi:flagellar L-ring protein precursor FlgH
MKAAVSAALLTVSFCVSAALAQDTFAPARQPVQAPAAMPAPTQPAPAAQPDPGLPPHSHIPGRNEPDPAEPLYGVSLLVVAPPKPRTYKTHDLVTIVVDETSKQAADQSLDTDKKVSRNAALNALIDPMQLAQLRLQAGDTSNLKLIDLSGDNKFNGKGSYARNDKLSLKIQAEIIDVKPNGVLALEARKMIDKNGETQTTVLSGVCRQEDITANNTVFSSQLANLALTTKSEGSVNEAGRKGIISKVLDALFAF